MQTEYMCICVEEKLCIPTL